MSGDSSKPKKNWGPIAAVLLGFLAYKVPEALVAAAAPTLLPILGQNQNVRSLVLYGTFEALTLATLYLLVNFYGKRFVDLGLGAFKLNYIAKAFLGFCSYFVLTAIVMTAVAHLVTIPDQQQQTGFLQPTGFEAMLAFIALIIVVPIAEELLFRGFIFKGIRSSFSFPVTAIVVSILFAAAHGQLNVGLDVFSLSLVLCYLREKTGSLWPGILVHGLKNAVAFFMLFIYNVH